MEFATTDKVKDLQAKAFDFLNERVIPAEAVYQLAIADPRVFTALRADAKLLLEELGVTPAQLD